MHRNALSGNIRKTGGAVRGTGDRAPGFVGTGGAAFGGQPSLGDGRNGYGPLAPTQVV